MTPFNCFIAFTIPRRRPRIFQPQTTDLTADVPSRGALRALAAYPCLWARLFCTAPPAGLCGDWLKDFSKIFIQLRCSFGKFLEPQLFNGRPREAKQARPW